jgi:hypothetical protein
VVEQEIKETVMISIAAILLASLLGFVSYLMFLRSDFATVRNTEVYAAEAMSNFREFNKYNGSTTLYGEDVTAAIRDYYDTGIRIRVNYPGGVYYIDKYDARDNKTLVDLQYLMSRFPTNTKYMAVPVYGQVDLATVTQAYTQSSFDTNVSGLVFFYTGVR